MTVNVTPPEKHRTGASGRILASLQERIERYERAIKEPGLVYANLSPTTEMYLRGARDGLQSAKDELEWRLRTVEDEAALVPEVEPEPWVGGSLSREDAPSWEELRNAGRA